MTPNFPNLSFKYAPVHKYCYFVSAWLDFPWESPSFLSVSSYFSKKMKV